MLAGGGDQVIVTKLHLPPEIPMLIALAVIRSLLLVACYSSGVPGGIFAPMLSIGAAIGLAYGGGVALVLPALGLEPGMFAVAAMGALFAAMVRAPLTGTVVVLEMTGNIGLTFAIMITTLAATFTAESLGGRRSMRNWRKPPELTCGRLQHLCGMAPHPRRQTNASYHAMPARRRLPSRRSLRLPVPFMVPQLKALT